MSIRDLNCERVPGYMSVWFGLFTDAEAYWHYWEDIFRVEDPTQYNPRYNLMAPDFDAALKALFKPENAARPFEAELKDLFEVCFNRFEYDFGVTFDQDFQVGGFCEEVTTDLSKLLGEWADDFTEPFTPLTGRTLLKPYNCFFAIPSCRYNGIITSVNAPEYTLDFLGIAAEDTYSDELTARYNG